MRMAASRRVMPIFILFACALAIASAMQTVHIVWSNHLDVGFFTPNERSSLLAASAIDRYNSVYFMNAIETANAFRNSNTTDRYIWTTHSWLVSMYFDCPPNMGFYCPNKTEQAMVQAAIQRGDITWHAFPFNSEGEMHTAELFTAGIGMSRDLAQKLGRVGGMPNTISQRDVPGTTRGLVPLLAKNGVKAFSIGENAWPASMGVARASLWVDTDSLTSTYLLYHGDGHTSYGGDRVSDAVIVDGLDDVLIMHWEMDNRGPSSNATAVSIFAQVRREFPNATVKTSTFDEFVNILDDAVRAGTANVPVITNQELSDTWIYGVAGDPLRMAQSRALARAHRDCIRATNCDSTSYAFTNFTRLLLKSYEHTWGGALARALSASLSNNNTEFFKWSNQAFHSAINDSAYQSLTDSYIEQRLWPIDYAMQALPQDHPILAQAQTEFNNILPRSANLTGYIDVTNHINNIEWNFGENYLIKFDVKTGAINSLRSIDNTQIYADNNHLLGVFLYKSYISADFQTFAEGYAGGCNHAVPQCGNWDFTKVYLDNFVPNIQQLTIIPTLTSVYIKNNTINNIEITESIILQYTFADNYEYCYINYGCPQSLIIQYDIIPTNNKHIDRIAIRLTWFNKTATRIPEAIWFNFNPLNSPEFPQQQILIEMLETLINPNDTLPGGTRALHATAGSVVLPGWMTITPIDSPLVSFGLEERTVPGILEATPFPTPLVGRPGDHGLASGIGFSLVNNIWNTNYPAWYPFVANDASSVFRFEMALISGSKVNEDHKTVAAQ